MASRGKFKRAETTAKRSASPMPQSIPTESELLESCSAEWPYDHIYSALLTEIDHTSVDQFDVASLKKIQRKLAVLAKSSQQRLAESSDELVRLAKVDRFLAESQAAPKKKRAGKGVPKKYQGPRGNGKKARETTPEADIAVKEEPEEPPMANDNDNINDNDNDNNNGNAGDNDNTGDNDNDVDKDVEMRDMTEIQMPERPETPEYEKNPKSEFVEAQKIPIAALGLFEEDQLPNHGEEYLKKKYGVASYPTQDLKHLLPGEIPDEDFTRAKPPNQVQFTTFATAIEPYFRPYTEEDISFLKQKAVGGDTQYGRPGLLDPFVIPPLGPLYVDQWSAEDGPNPGYHLSSQPPNTDTSEVRARGTEQLLDEDRLESDAVSLGPLASRLLEALLPEKKGAATASGAEEEDAQSALVDDTWKTSAPANADYAAVEERLKKEFGYVGIIDGAVPDRKDFKLAANPPEDGGVDWINYREDDEISHELRLLQKKLRVVTRVNQACKNLITPLVQEQMAYQEYSNILEDLDKQVDQAYTRRFRNPKAKKKKGTATIHHNPGPVLEKSGLKALIDKRQRWIDKIGPVFKPPETMKRVPDESVFKSLKVDDDDDEYA